MIRYLILILFSSIFLASGCANLNDLYKEVITAREEGNIGVAKVYQISAAQAWDITEAVFLWEKTDEVEEHRDENYVLTSTGMKMVAFGSVMGVWIEPIDPNNTKVTVITKRRAQRDRFTRLTESTFHERFAKGVQIIQKGEQLPTTPP